MVLPMGSAPPSPAEVFARLTSPESARTLRELSQIAADQDPQVVLQRTLDLSRAVATVGQEFAGRRDLDAKLAPVILRRLCEELGATYVKLGQFIASSPTLFPPEYVAEFQKCLDATPPMPWSVVKPLIETELGRPIEQIYSSVETTPLASASIAQVHAARLRTGEDVVIKVQKRGIQGSLRADLDLLYSVARMLQLAGLTTSDLSDVVKTLREAILEETDFVLEAKRTTQFRQFLQRSPDLAGAVTSPKVYPEASSAKVMTLERLYGVPLTDLEAVRSVTPNPELALILALNTWVTSVLVNEWFHADVHAGNLLVLRDGRVAFIDFGIVGSIPQSTATAMMDFVQSYALNDIDGIASAIQRMGFTAKDIDVRAFAVDLRDALASMQAIDPNMVSAGAVDETQLNALVSSVAKISESYGIRFPREFALLVKQVLYFDRYTRLLAPDLDVLSDDRIAMNRPSGSSMRTRERVVAASDIEVLPPP